MTTRETVPPVDPYAWLEEVEGEAALGWVRRRSEEAEDRLAGSAAFGTMRAQIQEVLESDARIPAVVEREGLLYNFWTDAAHPRGLWRRTTWESYRTGDPQWEVLLDVDALGAAEDTTWVWKGATVLRPGCERALVSLSRGGADAHVTRELDLRTKTFVADGFGHGESKGGIGWADATGETVFVYVDVGEDSLTTSGYPRTVRRWRRGTPLEAAEEVFTVDREDTAVAAVHDRTPGFERDLVLRQRAFYDTEVYLLGVDGSLTRIDVPRSAEAGPRREWLLVELREDWAVGGTTYPGGALLTIGLDDFLAGGRDFEILFAPTATTSLVGATWTRRHLVVTVLDDVVHRLEVLTPPASGPGSGPWRRRDLDLGAEVPEHPTVEVSGIDADVSDALWVTTTSYLAPTRLYRLDLDADGETVAVELLRSAPAFFDATGMRVEQHWATSADGTRVPYFEVSPAGEGPRPTLLWGYGGFEIPLLPAYSGVVGRAWLSRGGTYVVANIRGGGEYGPRWHRAALKGDRHRAYEDFAAVARDLLARGVTTREQLGVQGRSNGGLLAGNMLTRYPELFGAVVCQVPLLDMKRYSRLLAGASWMAEYGDPDDPEQWEFIRTFSPYHLFEEDRDYPPVFFATSTRDDRVHPGHARKMAALMLAAGKDVTYWENTEGGHGGAADHTQKALWEALGFEFLWQRLGAATASAATRA